MRHTFNIDVSFFHPGVRCVDLSSKILRLLSEYSITCHLLNRINRIMFWHTVVSIFCVFAASASAFVTPIGRVVNKSPVPYLHHASTQLNATRSLAVAGRIPWGKIILDCQQRIQLMSIIRQETHVLDVSLVSCNLCIREMLFLVLCATPNTKLERTIDVSFCSVQCSDRSLSL